VDTPRGNGPSARLEGIAGFGEKDGKSIGRGGKVSRLRGHMLGFVQWQLEIKDWQNVGDLWQAALIAKLSSGSKLGNYLVR
jgi:hypothetical protein